MIRWIVEHFGLAWFIGMALWAFTDPRPSHDVTRNGKRYRNEKR